VADFKPTTGRLAPTCGPRFGGRKFDYPSDSQYAILRDCLGSADDALRVFLEAVDEDSDLAAQAEMLRNNVVNMRHQLWLAMTDHERDVRLEDAR
jgi:hypothetical protein